MPQLLKSDPANGVGVAAGSVFFSLGSTHWQNLTGGSYAAATFDYSPPGGKAWADGEMATMNMANWGGEGKWYSAKRRLNLALGYGTYEQSLKVGVGSGVTKAAIGMVTARCRPRLVSHHGLAPHLHYAPLDAGLPARVRALTASGLAHLIADGDGHRLGCCLRDDCGVVFVDVSRGGRRRFCSVRCANAVNVRRHRARAQSAGGAVA